VPVPPLIEEFGNRAAGVFYVGHCVAEGDPFEQPLDARPWKAQMPLIVPFQKRTMRDFIISCVRR
jgi:hypothetical protein